MKEAKDAHKSQLINQTQGKARFKTFRANNELFMRIDEPRSGDVASQPSLVKNENESQNTPKEPNTATLKDYGALKRKGLSLPPPC